MKHKAAYYIFSQRFHISKMTKYLILGFLAALLSPGCMDYIRVDDNLSLNNDNFRPSIDFKHIIPQPSRLDETMSIGKNCKGQSFKVPPITDKNPQDLLYYIWFLDNKLLGPQLIIKPELRSKDVIVLNIDENFINNHFGAKVPVDFFSKPHLIEFFVSDKPYTIPESRYINDVEDEERNHSDYVYWISWFSNDPC